MKQFGIQVMATTDDPADDLAPHAALAQDPTFTPRVIPTFRPDRYLEPARDGWAAAVKHLGAAAGIDVGDYAGYVAALEDRRRYFISHGATSADHSHLDAIAEPLDTAEAERIYRLALSGQASADEATAFRRHMVLEMARMSCDDGLVMTLHPGVRRNHHPATFARFGADTGHDIPVAVEFTNALQPLLERYGTHPNLHLVLFTLDADVFNREIAPLAGFYPVGLRGRTLVVPGQPQRHPQLPATGHRDRRPVTGFPGSSTTPGRSARSRRGTTCPAGWTPVSWPAWSRSTGWTRTRRSTASPPWSPTSPERCSSYDRAIDAARCRSARPRAGAAAVPGRRRRRPRRAGADRAPRARQLLPRPPGLVHRPGARQRRVGDRRVHRTVGGAGAGPDRPGRPLHPDHPRAGRRLVPGDRQRQRRARRLRPGRVAGLPDPSRGGDRDAHRHRGRLRPRPGRRARRLAGRRRRRSRCPAPRPGRRRADRARPAGRRIRGPPGRRCRCVTVVSCDNLPDNGAVTARVVGDFARLLDAELADWIERHVSFVTTMVDRITPATAADDARSVADADRPDRCRAGGHRAVHRVGAQRRLPRWSPGLGRRRCPVRRRHRTLRTAKAVAAQRRSLAAGLRRQCPRAPDHRRGDDGPGLPGVAAAVLGGGVRAPDPARRRGGRLSGRADWSGSATRGSGTCSRRSRPTDHRRCPSGCCPPCGPNARRAGCPTGALRVLAAWINHLRGAGAPVKDGNAELLVPLAQGPLDQAVPRVLDYLDADLAADAAVVSEVTDLCRQLDKTSTTNSREGNRS